MEVTDHKNAVPLSFYRERFAAADPEALSLRSGVPFESGVFSLKLLNRPVTVAWPSSEIRYEGTDEPMPGPEKILLIRLLLDGVLAPGLGSFKAYREMPWGEVYLTQFTGRVITRLAYSFAAKPDAFTEKAAALGGRQTDGGDCAVLLPFISAGGTSLMLKLILWAPDEDDPPAAQVLFSDNFSAAFTAEDMAVVGDIMINHLKKA